MQRGFLLPAGLLGLALVIGLAVAASSRPQHEGRVYAVAAVRAQLERDPQAWVGRTVVVRALAEPCPWWDEQARLLHCAGKPLVLVGMPADAPAAPLPLILPAPQPLVSALRRLPILGALLPQPRMVPLFAPAHFRVRLLALPACSGAGCDQALLLSVAPVAHRGR